jgi:PPOX class probable F420-dependent enzyme
MAEVPAAFHDLFEKPTIAHVVTMTPDGAPHATPVWIDYDAGANRLLVNTERGRRKERNVARDPTVAASMVDPDDPHRYLSVTGSVAETTTEGAREHIDALSERYLGEPYSNPIGTERVVLRVRPEEVLTRG